MRQGTATLGTLAEAAVKRFVEKPGARLFSHDELKTLADTLAATTATGELLGRARIRQRQAQARAFHESRLEYDDARREKKGSGGVLPLRFSDAPTDFSAFAEPIHPLAPRAALDHFRALVPSLKLDAAQFADRHERQAFTLAEAADRVLLDKVKGAIQRGLEQGEPRQAVQDVQSILDGAGVTPANSQYAEMVFRTNAMQAYNAGSTKEMQDPDVRDDFPVWQYLGIDDGRQGDDHDPHFDNYYSNDTDFDDIRGERVQNCRCSFSPVYRDDWDDLRKDGALVSRFAELPVPHVRQQTPWSCGPSALRAAAAAFGVNVSEPQLRDLTGADPDAGTPPEALLDAAHKLGLRATAEERMTLGQLAAALDAGHPVLLPIQAWGEPDEEAALQSGHWVCLVGRDSQGFLLEDPAVDGTQRVRVSPQELRRRWRDEDSEGRSYEQFGIVIAGPSSVASLYAELSRFCGGRGSGRPGPCGKSGGHEHKARGAAERLRQARNAHARGPTEKTADALVKAQAEHDAAQRNLPGKKSPESSSPPVDNQSPTGYNPVSGESPGTKQETPVERVTRGPNGQTFDIDQSTGFFKIRQPNGKEGNIRVERGTQASTSPVKDLHTIMTVQRPDGVEVHKIQKHASEQEARAHFDKLVADSKPLRVEGGAA